jgi:hypothetical protein
MIDSVLLVPPALVLASVSLPAYRSRRAGLAAVLLIQLTIASLELTGALGGGRHSLSPGYLAVSAAMLLVGLFLVASIAVYAGLAQQRTGQGSRPLMLAGGLLTLLVVAQLARMAIPLALAGGVIRTLAAFAMTIGGGTLLVFLVRARVLKQALGWVDQRLAPRRAQGPDAPTPRGNPVMLALHLAGVLLALVAPTLPLLVLGVLLAGIFGMVWEYQAGGPRVPLGGIVSLAALLAGAGWLYQVAGDTPLVLDQMTDGPFSPAFQAIAAVILALAAWPLLRLWPLHGTRTGPAGALAGAAILLRVLASIVPDGSVHWQPVFYGLLAAGAWYAAVVRTDAVLGATVAAAGLLSGFPEAGWGGVAVLTAAIVLQILGRATRTVPVALIAGRAILIGASFAMVPLLVGALQAEVFWTVAILIGAVIGLLAAEDRRRVDRGPSLV